MSSVFFAHSAAAATNLSQDYNFVSGGIQYNHYKDKAYKKAENAKKSDMTRHTAGGYLRGSWNFYDNMFVEARAEGTKNGDLKETGALAGVGYFMPVNDKMSVYGLAGYSAEHVKLGKSKVTEKGLTGEVGAKYQVMDNWTVEPAVRYAKYHKAGYEFRLGNNFKVTDHVSIEANVARNNVKLMYGENHDQEVKLKETNFELGARYNF
ncbi:hypothetical protein A8L45_01155 [Veronia pacifica]|uniref:Outer membrane protein beta-barrel domain-containing protein n=2 Tax=Veronia pacifica TaxID=1080227 RepID=A0A1C3ESN1_9GAMM|nr:hypothetical protein A8L45_01155 [Veronia pacifica]